MRVSSTIRKFTLLLTLSSLSLAVMNCSKKDDPSTSEGQIVGTWKMTNYFVKEGNDPEIDQYALFLLFLPCVKDLSLTFNSNGTLTGNNITTDCADVIESLIGDTKNAKYAVAGDQLTITDSNKVQTVIKVSFSGKQMSWIDTSTTGGVTTTERLVFTKQ
ncbi:lipocalin family protein [Emticicia sp. 17c]|uniref:lipocalin family protein n=1 Tax=Emticicia sp. 17c TaxID=3127704 RepID=UPI00301D6B84